MPVRKRECLRILGKALCNIYYLSKKPKLFKLEEFRNKCLRSNSKMSEDISRLPPQIQQRLLRLQQLQQTLQGVMAQKQQLEMQLTEVEQAAGELEKLDETAVVYKSIGALLVKSEKDKVSTELTERKELVKMRVDVLVKQEERLRTQVKDLQEKLQQDLRPVSGSA